MARLSRRTFLAQAAATCGVLAGCTPCAPRQQAPPGAPNIVVLLTDDQRWDALGCMGNPLIQTPNLDALSAAGTTFGNTFCTTSICAASRTSIYTGLHTRCHGVVSFVDHISPRAYADTYPVILREAGYETAFVGKWGIGITLPCDRFDYFEGFSGQGKYWRDGDERHLTRKLGDDTVAYLQTRSPGRPFCLSVSFKAPHVQDGAPVEYDFDPAFAGLHAEEHIPLSPAATEEHFAALPLFLQTSENRLRWEKRFDNPERAQQSIKGYYRLIAGMDEAVGRILDALAAEGLADNTIVVFTSDNGVLNGEHGLAGKWLMREESIRVPLLIHDPRAPGAGRWRPEMALNIDLAPTVIDLAGLDPSPGMQGRSLVPLLSEEDVPWRAEWFYENQYVHTGKIRPCDGIRTPDWTYTRYLGMEPAYEELFDLNSDPLQEHNLADQPGMADTMAHFRVRRQRWRDALTAYNPYSCEPWMDPV